MEMITTEMVIAALVVLGSNGITLKWLKSDIKKAGERSENHRQNIRDLYKRTNDMMSKQEIVELVRQVNEPMKEDIHTTNQTLKILSENVVNMTVTIARMDERMKNRIDTGSRTREGDKHD